MQLRILAIDEKPPIDLLLLADPSIEMIEEYIHKGDCYVSEWDGSIQGVFVLLSTRPGIVELVNVAVSKEHQGKGYGKKLVLAAIDIAKSKGYKTIEVGTGNSSIDQLALYQKCGFRMMWIDKDFFIRHYNELIYENGIQCVDMVRLSMDL
ncbi:GNAT family N-acetyltransferase [Cytobacillus dafuensis]|uniref:GNAT family N-acetyltransferase n=1 Tax=Cytobacillus dafuensis TaxID=1742359 RepID=A0A5B8Z478_CYTDA|nr:GNAT family N-acetyltransferase [Cytobacillus dafuensis]QED47922.1 GNAT family N-acetyltransferase [Cytobacillus dafuensis]